MRKRDHNCGGLSCVENCGPSELLFQANRNDFADKGYLLAHNLISKAEALTHLWLLRPRTCLLMFTDAMQQPVVLSLQLLSFRHDNGTELYLLQGL